MAYKRAADGVAQRGKTEGKNLGDSGPTQAIQKEAKPSGNPGKSNANMLKLGRNLAKVAAQKRG